MRYACRFLYETRSGAVISKVVSRVEVAGTDSGLHPVAAYFIWGTYGQEY